MRGNSGPPSAPTGSPEPSMIPTSAPSSSSASISTAARSTSSNSAPSSSARCDKTAWPGTSPIATTSQPSTASTPATTPRPSASPASSAATRWHRPPGLSRSSMSFFPADQTHLQPKRTAPHLSPLSFKYPINAAGSSVMIASTPALIILFHAPGVFTVHGITCSPAACAFFTFPFVTSM